MAMTSRSGGAGYTLPEIMIVVVIMGILSTSGAQLLLQVQRYYILAQTRASILREARAAMYVITRELREGQISTITVDQVVNQPFCSRVSFIKTQDSASGTVTSFYQKGNQLIQQRKTTTTTQSKPLSTHLIYLAFTLPRSDNLAIVSVDLTLQETIFQGQTRALHMASEQVQIMN
jgi:prepilin-type N-terminal cleavage/methylation domain-containing protein